MGVQDLIVTPIYLILFTVLAYFIRPYVTNKQTRKYFLPALWVRFGGAIALGLVYQFYYNGGDTFNYFTHGSKWIWQAFLDSPQKGLHLLFESGGNLRPTETFKYSQHIWYYRDVKSFSIVRIVAFFDLFTIHTYTATSLFFAVLNFSGMWAMYAAVQSRFSTSRYLHIAILFIPSVIFWGSGILKDTITLGALGWVTWAMVNALVLRRKIILSSIVGAIGSLIILKIKSYIILCFIPVVFVYFYFQYVRRIRNVILKSLLVPILFFFIGGFSFLAVTYASTDEYNIDNFAKRAAITAYDIRYGWGARTDGDGGYDIGIPDGSWQSMIGLAPKAIVVSLFRPFPWEVRNFFMLLTALESLIVSVLTIRLFRIGGWRKIVKDPFLLFCLSFSLLFAFAVGVSTGNFGTLMRYKIPIMPFYLLVLTVRKDVLISE